MLISHDKNYAIEFHDEELREDDAPLPEPVYSCPKCGSEAVEFGPYDAGMEVVTGYSHTGTAGYCLECQTIGEASDFGYETTPTPDSILELARSIDLRNLLKLPAEDALEYARRGPARAERPVVDPDLPEVA